MRGHLNMTFKEVDDEKSLSASVECALENVTTVDKLIIVHNVLETLRFDEDEHRMLRIVVNTNIWPDDMLEETLK